MDSNDKPEFVRVITSLAAIKGKDLTKDVLLLWWQCLKDWPVDDFKNAAGYLLKNCQFMATPYDFEQLRKKGEVSAHEAFSMALQHGVVAWQSGQNFTGAIMIDLNIPIPS